VRTGKGESLYDGGKDLAQVREGNEQGVRGQLAGGTGGIRGGVERLMEHRRGKEGL